MKNLADYTDFNGFIGHIDPSTGKLEFGDGAQRLGSYFFAMWLASTSLAESVIIRDKFQALFWTLVKTDEKGKKYFVRHPDSSFWWGRPGTMSRDQLIPLIVCCSVMRLEEELQLIHDLLKERHGFCWNTKEIGEDREKKFGIPDYCGISTFAAIYRGLSPKDHLDDIVIADYFYRFHVAWRCILTGFDADNVGDALNMFMLLKQSQLLCPTKSSKWSCDVFRKLPRAGIPIISQDRIQSSFDWYYRHDEAPPMNEVMRKVIASF